MKKLPNIIIIVSDTLRTSYLGCYGNKDIKTPNIDLFAKESAVFTSAYPESLPTIPARRSLHTGRRAFPFKDYKPLKWDVVYLPGWQPLSNEEDTLAENLASAGYCTGFVTDTMTYFQPGFNFTRGFWQWEFTRGKEMDRWRSGSIVPKELLSKYGNPDEIMEKGKDIPVIKYTASQELHDELLSDIIVNNMILRHVANTMHIHSEEDTSTALNFKWAMEFIDNNRKEPFYLMIDCFDPHEPWEAPTSYLEMYADPNYKGKTIIYPEYGPINKNMSSEEIKNIIANYCGLVSLLDTWFGNFISKLKRLELYDDSLIIFTSDHGTNFGDNHALIMGKPNYSMYPGLMNIPLILHLPNSPVKGLQLSNLVYNIDAIATVYDYIGLNETIKNLQKDGQSLLPLILNKKWAERDYVDSRYSNNLWYRDSKYWIIFDITKKVLAAFDFKNDPLCKIDISNNIDEKIIEDAWGKIFKDANGCIPDYRNLKETDAVGRY
ncbi:MAG: sulfatase [Actinobacteria bacterium]|nr:sulfatase [Actinomycetota bacterium]